MQIRPNHMQIYARPIIGSHKASVLRLPIKVAEFCYSKINIRKLLLSCQEAVHSQDQVLLPRVLCMRFPFLAASEIPTQLMLDPKIFI